MACRIAGCFRSSTVPKSTGSVDIGSVFSGLFFVIFCVFGALQIAMLRLCSDECNPYVLKGTKIKISLNYLSTPLNKYGLEGFCLYPNKPCL